uniref:PDZ domain-containing protein n=1 Tax=Syphacia muris TaxID=451379 RepID=A0A0N5APG3_9BILA
MHTYQITPRRYEENFPVQTLKFRPLGSLTRMKADEVQESESHLITIKSKFGEDFRRISLRISDKRSPPTFDSFYSTICQLHKIDGENACDVSLTYISHEKDRLPISNDENLRKAFECGLDVLKIFVQKKGESLEEKYGYGLPETSILRKKKTVSISNPQDFRRVSAIVDADILPFEYRRVRLCKYHNNKPLGFYIRDGLTERFTPWGPITMNGIFISRLLENGLAASTNLLAVNDEVLEVNGIEVAGKTLDQVTDMMIANASNLILTVKPAKQPKWLPNIQPPFLPPPPYTSLQRLNISSLFETPPVLKSFSRTSTNRVSENKVRPPSLCLRTTHVSTGDMSKGGTDTSSLLISNVSTKILKSSKRSNRPYSVHFGDLSTRKPSNITVF